MRTLCDVCESAAAILFCAADEAALCRSCDEKFPGNKLGRSEELGLQPLDQKKVRRDENQLPDVKPKENEHNHTAVLENNIDGDYKIDNTLIDLNTRPQRIRRQASNNQEQGVGVLNGLNDESVNVVPVGSFKK